MVAVHARVPGIPHQTVELAATLCMADVEAAVQLLSTSALSSSTTAPSLASLLSSATHVSTLTAAASNGSSGSGSNGSSKKGAKSAKKSRASSSTSVSATCTTACLGHVLLGAAGAHSSNLLDPSSGSKASQVPTSTSMSSPISVRRSTVPTATTTTTTTGKLPSHLTGGPTTTTLEILLTLSDDPDATFSPQDMAAAISAAVALNVAQTSGSSASVSKSFPPTATAVATPIAPRSNVVSFSAPSSTQSAPCQTPSTPLQQQQQTPPSASDVTGAKFAAAPMTSATTAAAAPNQPEQLDVGLMASVLPAVDSALAEAAAAGYCYSQVDIACELKQFTDRLLALQNGEGAGDAAGRLSRPTCSSKLSL